MGRWAYGPYDSDGALDYMDTLGARLYADVRRAVTARDFDDDTAGVALATLVSLRVHVGGRPTQADAAALRKKYLARLGELGEPAYVAKRRPIVTRLLNALVAWARAGFPHRKTSATRARRRPVRRRTARSRRSR